MNVSIRKYLNRQHLRYREIIDCQYQTEKFKRRKVFHGWTTEGFIRTLKGQPPNVQEAFLRLASHEMTSAEEAYIRKEVS